MYRPFAVLLLAMLPTISLAQSEIVDRTVEGVILPAFAQFALTTKALDAAANADCTATNPLLRDSYNAAFDAWIGVETYRAGPLEKDGRGLEIAFWPDLKGAIPKALQGLINAGDIPEGADFAQVSVAARGLFGLEAMLYDPAFNSYGPTDPGCALTRAITADLAATAERVNDEWQNDFGPLMLRAGDAGNARFLAADEVIQLLFTAALTELEFLSDQRIARPLGTIDRPRPNRAEARLSGRSLRNAQLSIEAIKALAFSLAGVTTGEMADRLNYASFAAGKIADPAFADLETTSGRFRLQELHDAVTAAREAVNADLTARLAVGVGFNSMDGD